MNNTVEILGGGTPIETLKQLDSQTIWLLKRCWIDSVEAYEALPEEWRRLFGDGENAGLIEENSSLPDQGTMSKVLCGDNQAGADDILGGNSSMPAEIRLMDRFFPIRDQKGRGSCTAFATTALCEYGIENKARLSEQFLYWATKEISECSLEDLADGAMFESVQRALDQYGICAAADWQYSGDPSRWSVSADPRFEYEGDARIAALQNAAQYRIHGFRAIPHGAVSQFRLSLAKGFPVVIGIPCFLSWRTSGPGKKNNWVIRTGRLSLPLETVLTINYPFGSLDALAAEMRENMDEDESLSREAVESEAIDKVHAVVSNFLPDSSVCIVRELEQEYAIVVIKEVASGRHALCLAGYVDDGNVPGGGYFIARNSWGTKWAYESPESQGYALIPYAYFKEDVAPEEEGVSGFTFVGMPEVPEYALAHGADEKAWHSGVQMRHAAASVPGPSESGIKNPAVVDEEWNARCHSFGDHKMEDTPPPKKTLFDQWLSERLGKADCKRRDKAGLLLYPGMGYILLDPKNDRNAILCDTPENRERMRDAFEKDTEWLKAVKEKEH